MSLVMSMNVLPFTTDCTERGPDSLLDLCFKYVIRHLETIGTVNPVTKAVTLNSDLVLPSEICEKLLHDYQRESRVVLDDRFINVFQDTQTTRLQRVKLRYAQITDSGLRVLLRHKLSELEISHCCKLSRKSLHYINEKSNNLVSLVIGASARILPISLITEDSSHEDVASLYVRNGYILKCPRLRRLAVRNHRVPLERLYFPTLLKPMNNLTHLDLSGCYDLGDLAYLTSLKDLVSLILHNVEQVSIKSLCELKTLRHLDISQSSDKNGIYPNENQVLTTIVESLPRLSSLDISGTNLAGTGVAEHRAAESSKQASGGMTSKTDIPGLISRVSNPFEFLGLYGTLHDACRRHDIPAKMVSGDANEAQILVAAAAYIDRPEVLQKVLNELYHLFRYETCQNMNQALGTVLEAMNRHLNEKHIQISGSATLFYIVKGKENRHVFGPKIKRAIIGSLLNGMAAHKDDDTMLRNGCLTLCQFKIPEDVLFDYERLVHILLYIVSEMEQEGFVQRIGIYLLNSLACQVDGFQKQLLGDLGAIERMLSLIEDRLDRRVCDDVLEVAWSTMWNVTDETAVNCLRFLNGKGMEFFLGCLSTFPDKEELLRNMMGLLGNVAEVQKLRPRLMTSQFVSVFADLLDSFSDGIEVSYNAAGVLSHMASDGPDAWALASPRREDVLARMVAAIERWDLSTERNINYRSFEPILYLARVYHSPECQHWAVWALANLTKVYPVKYCSLVESEGGLAVLAEIMDHPQPYPRIKELAAMVRANCAAHTSKHQWHDHLYEMLTLDG